MKLNVILALCSLILAGCSSVQQTIPEQAGLPLSWQQHVEKVKLIQNWQANAQVAITIGKETQRAKMAWQQAQQDYSIDFTGPFGHSGPKLIGNNNSATLNIPKEGVIKGSSASQLLKQRLGWHLPVENAKYWILGIPSPHSESKVLLKREKLSQLSQDGWVIKYPKYKLFGDMLLPSKITISRDDFNLLLVIYKWNTDQQVTTK
jgi:outer membrane lipoprotein LolB